MTTTTISPVTITPNTDGSPRIRWDMTIEEADTVMTMLGGAFTFDTDKRAALIDPLYQAVSQAMDTTVKEEGCTDLWPDAAPMPLTTAAVLGNVTGDMLAVLLPGSPTYLDAINSAISLAQEAGANLDTTDENLFAEVQPARWMVLNQCESNTHDFHPELAMFGERTPGAVLVTRVDIIQE